MVPTISGPIIVVTLAPNSCESDQIDENPQNWLIEGELKSKVDEKGTLTTQRKGGNFRTRENSFGISVIV